MIGQAIRAVRRLFGLHRWYLTGNRRLCLDCGAMQERAWLGGEGGSEWLPMRHGNGTCGRK